MSAASSSSKGFVGYLKGLFRKSDASNTAVADVQPRSPEPPAPRAPVLPVHPQSGNGNGNNHGSFNGIRIPLQAILATLPLELSARVIQKEVGDLTVPVGYDRILSQLGSGMVKVNFGEIRLAAPHVFSPGTNCDRVVIVLPLGEILPRLKPAMLMRRPCQKQIEVPADIVSPFGAQGEGLVFSVGSPKSESHATPSLAVPASHSTVTPGAALARARGPLPATAPNLPEQIFKRAPAPSIAPTSDPVTPSSVPPSVAVTPPSSPLPPKDSAPATKSYFSSMPVPRAIKPAQPTQPEPGTPNSVDATTLLMSLSSLAQNWPEALRKEIVQVNLTDARLALPAGLIEAALKRGWVSFPWKTIRTWIRPSPVTAMSANDNMDLELPLNVLAPLFLAYQKATDKPHQKVTIDEAIPNLFFGLPKPDSPAAENLAAPTAKPADTNYYVWDDVSETAHVDESEIKRNAPTGTDFVRRCATPNEIVSRAAALDGVAGALIALPDGLMVASRIPTELNGDTLAAFLPQIFAKVSQTTRELRMGELNNLNFTVGNVPWKIFRVNAVFFATFGRAGEPLPTAQLSALAVELDHRNK